MVVGLSCLIKYVESLVFSIWYGYVVFRLVYDDCIYFMVKNDFFPKPWMLSGVLASPLSLLCFEKFGSERDLKKNLQIDVIG